MNQRIWLVGMFWMLVCCGPTAALARPLDIQDELQRRSPTGHRFSPDGSLVAVTLRRLDGFEKHWNRGAWDNSDESVRRSAGQQVLVIEAATERVLYASDPAVSAFDPVWTPDGQSLVFCARGAEAGQIWTWDRRTGEVRKGLDQLGNSLLSIRGVSFQLADGGSKVVARINAAPPEDVPGGRARRGRDAASAPASIPADAWRPLVFNAHLEPPAPDAAAHKNPPPLATMRYELAAWNLRTGDKQPIDADGMVYQSSVSPDGRRIAYWRYRAYSGMPRVVYFFDLRVYDFKTGENREIAHNVQIQPMEAALYWAPDSNQIVYYSHVTTGAETVTGRTLWVFDLAADAPRRLIDAEADGRLTGGAPIWADDSARFYILTKEGPVAVEPGSAAVSPMEVPAGFTVGGLMAADQGKKVWLSATHQSDSRAVVLNFDPAAKAATVAWELPAGAASPTISPDGKRLLFFSQAAHLAPSLWVWNRTEPAARPFAGLTVPAEGVELGRSKLIDFYTSDGVKLKAALLLPPDYDGKTPLPTIVWVYPGRQSRAVDVYGLGGTGPMNAQLLASRGYAVLKPDSVMNDGWPVESLARSVLPAITTLINQGIADPARIGLWGHSQGGMSTVALLTRSTIFKAAVVSNGYYNLLSFYGTLDPRGRDYSAHILEEYNNIFTTPWKNQRVYLENSPVLNLDRVKTPLLLTVGLGDSSVNGAQAEEVFVGLKRLGTKVSLVEYPGGTHVPYDWETNQQIDYAGRMIGWFDEHLKGKGPEAGTQRATSNR